MPNLNFDVPRRLSAEAMGTAFLLATVVGSGIMAERLAELVATFGLVATIFAAIRLKPYAVACMVGLYITAAYWFTASTSFANPAVTAARFLYGHLFRNPSAGRPGIHCRPTDWRRSGRRGARLVVQIRTNGVDTGLIPGHAR